MEIAKYNIKKTWFKQQIEQWESIKETCESSLDNSACSDVSVNNEDPFTEGLEPPECASILINCMQNLEKQVGQIFKMLKKIENYQIRDKCQLIDLAKVVDFITQKFNDYEKDWCEKDEIIATL